MKCFYHIDADGQCAGFWVNYFTKGINEKREFIPINYGMPFPFESIQKNESIYIVDFSIEPEEMEKLLTITENVVWIDHHITAIQKYEGFKTKIKGIRRNGIAGCMLTWFYFQAQNRNWGDISKEKLNYAPYFTKLIADYDVWTFEYGDDTRFFHMTVTAYDPSPIDDRWNLLMKPEADVVHKWIAAGKNMMIYRDSFAKSYCDNYGYEKEFEGLKAFVLNLGMCGSDSFKSVSDKDYDLYIGTAYNGSVWTYSLRAAKENIDVSVIAKKYGGGGHKGAAGFRSETQLV